SAVTSQSGVPPQNQKIPGAKLAAAPEPQVVRILVKTPWQQEEFLVHRDMLVREFKELVARHFSAAPKHVVLVQAGRILKDHKALGHHGALLEADATVYVVVRSPWARPSRQASAGPPGGAPGQKPSQSSTSAGDGLRALTASLGLNTATFAEFQSRLMSHPDIMLRLLEDPSIQSKLSSPSLVRQVLLANPEIQQLAQRVPAVGHILNNADIVWVILDKMREIMGWVRSPSLPQEPKSPEQPSGGLWSSAPGGDSPSRPPSSESQEPGLGRGPDSSAAPSPCGPLAWGSWPEHAGLWGPGLHAEGQEGCLPLSLSSTSLCPGGSRPDEGGPFSGLARPLEHGAPLPAPGVAGIPAPGSAEIPLRIVSLCNAYTKHMMLSLMWGSLLAVGGGQAAPREHVQQQLLRFSQQMRSPEMVAAMANPKAIQAWVQMEQGLQTLLAEAPVLVPWFMLRLRGLGCSGPHWQGEEGTLARHPSASAAGAPPGEGRFSLRAAMW
uniref:Ubiquitin-like domain-containing protein n=1 Tax=Varanus komodoensis TaxID=61221 RepID=A0A8D2LCW5_VARKO